MADEGFHEIELKGKQLVFLFMAATVVSVVIFLCGVMVGRGIRAPIAGDEPTLSTEAAVDPTAIVQAASAPLRDGAPVSTKEALTYDRRLESTTPVAETLRPPVEPAAASAPEPPSEPVPDDDPPPARANEESPAASDPKLTEPSGNGYVVQVMAARTRAEAERVARGLDAKGYPAFVTMATGASPSRFRVRVGKYNNLREAESMAQRLKKEEQFNTWITR